MQSAVQDKEVRDETVKDVDKNENKAVSRNISPKPDLHDLS